VVVASSNHACAMCPIGPTVHDIRVPVADMDVSSNHACATCPVVATGEAHPLLLGHHSSDGTAAAGHLPVSTGGYGPLLQKCIVVVDLALQENAEASLAPTSSSGVI
jgi:hypothetical protein